MTPNQVDRHISEQASYIRYLEDLVKRLKRELANHSCVLKRRKCP